MSARDLSAGAVAGFAVRMADGATLDNSEPTARAPLYTGPITLRDSASIRARAFRHGVETVSFTTAGTDVTAISYGRFTKRALIPAAAPPSKLGPGLRWEYVEDTWLARFSHLHRPEVLVAQARGSSARPLDVSMRRGDGPFGVRETGYLDVPADGLYTFYAPPDYVGATCEPGYDLRILVDGEEWELGQGHTWNDADQSGRNTQPRVVPCSWLRPAGSRGTQRRCPATPSFPSWLAKRTPCPSR